MIRLPSYPWKIRPSIKSLSARSISLSNKRPRHLVLSHNLHFSLVKCATLATHNKARGVQSRANARRRRAIYWKLGSSHDERERKKREREGKGEDAPCCAGIINATVINLQCVRLINTSNSLPCRIIDRWGPINGAIVSRRRPRRSIIEITLFLPFSFIYRGS